MCLATDAVASQQPVASQQQVVDLPAASLVQACPTWAVKQLQQGSLRNLVVACRLMLTAFSRVAAHVPVQGVVGIHMCCNF